MRGQTLTRLAALVTLQSSERRRLIKLLEMADIELAGVVSDIFGVSGRAILRALIPTGQARGLKAHGDRQRRR